MLINEKKKAAAKIPDWAGAVSEEEGMR